MDEEDLYDYCYPIQLEWARAQWVADVGDYVEDGDCVFEITARSCSAVAGDEPKFTFKKAAKDNDDSSTP